MKFFKPEDFQDIDSKNDREEAAESANAKLEREGKVVYSKDPFEKSTWTHTLYNHSNTKALLINIEKIEDWMTKFGDLNTLIDFAKRNAVSVQINYWESDDTMSLKVISAAPTECFSQKRILGIDQFITNWMCNLEASIESSK